MWSLLLCVLCVSIITKLLLVYYYNSTMKKSKQKIIVNMDSASKEEMVEGATEEKVLWPTLGEVTAVFKKYKVCMTCPNSCGFCQCFDPYLCKLHYNSVYSCKFLRKCVLGMRLMSPCKM